MKDREEKKRKREGEIQRKRERDKVLPSWFYNRFFPFLLIQIYPNIFGSSWDGKIRDRKKKFGEKERGRKFRERERLKKK